MRGLTHRGVDTTAGIPQGSTSYYFRSRSALVAGCVARLVELDLAIEAPAVATAGPDTFVDVLVAVAVAMATTGRHRTLARHELSLAAVRDSRLRAALVQGGNTIRGHGAATLAGMGAADPVAAAAELAAVLDGLVFTAMVRGPDDPAELAAWMRPAVAHVVMAHLRPGGSAATAPGGNLPRTGGAP
jgi:AcrR family transcriptional regulator